MSPSAALALAGLAAAMTMVGWLVALRGRSWSPRGSGIALVVAASAMLLISVLELLPSSAAAGLPLAAVAIACLAGVGFVLGLNALASRFNLGGSQLGGSAWVIAIALGIHNIPEGAAPYAAALVSVEGGLITAIAIGLHNIPEGLAIATPVIAAGGSAWQAFWLTMVATGGELGGAMLAFAVSAVISDAVAGVLVAVVAGVMITISVRVLLPAAVVLLRSDTAESVSTSRG